MTSKVKVREREREIVTQFRAKKEEEKLARGRECVCVPPRAVADGIELARAR